MIDRSLSLCSIASTDRSIDPAVPTTLLSFLFVRLFHTVGFNRLTPRDKQEGSVELTHSLQSSPVTSFIHSGVNFRQHTDTHSNTTEDFTNLLYNLFSVESPTHSTTPLLVTVVHDSDSPTLLLQPLLQRLTDSSANDSLLY